MAVLTFRCRKTRTLRKSMDRFGPPPYTPLRMIVQLSVKTGVRYDSDAEVYVSSCPELGLVSQGTTEEEAERAIQSAINLFVITCYELDILRSTMQRLRATNTGVTASDN